MPRSITPGAGTDTARTGRARSTGPPNVWLGTSVEGQLTADERISHLLETPAAVRFVSAEPLLGPVDMSRLWVDRAVGVPGLRAFGKLRPIPFIDWVIVGGESGPGARPMNPDWSRSLRDQCQAAGVAFHFKRWGEWVGAEIYTENGQGRLTRSQAAGASFPDALIRWWSGDCRSAVVSLRVGKRAANRLLDGKTWDEMPKGAR